MYDSVSGSALQDLQSLSPAAVLVLVSVVSSAMSQASSNSTTVTIMIPVVFAVSATLNTNPLYLALGVTVTASYAFMLPVGTPYNAIVYTAGQVNLFSSRYLISNCSSNSRKEPTCPSATWPALGSSWAPSSC